MSTPTKGDLGTCVHCDQLVEYVGGAWRADDSGASCPRGGRHEVHR